MQEKSADCGENGTFLVESPKDVQRDNVQSTKGKGQDNSQKSGQSPKAKRVTRGTERAANYIRLKKKKEGCPDYPDVMDEEDEQNSMNND